MPIIFLIKSCTYYSQILISINFKDKVLLFPGLYGFPVISWTFSFTSQVMEASPVKRARLDSNISILKHCVSSSGREIVDYMDMDNESVSHLIEKESEVNNKTSDSSSPGESMAQKASTSNKTSTENVPMLFERFHLETDRKPKHMLSVKEFSPARFHKWGILFKIKENSSTLRELSEMENFENTRSCKETFIKILEELKFDYTIVELKSGKPEVSRYIFAFDVKSIPRYSFMGVGTTKDKAINEAAKKGLDFFVVSCQ